MLGWHYFDRKLLGFLTGVHGNVHLSEMYTFYTVYLQSLGISSGGGGGEYIVVVVCCHLDPLLHPPDTTTPLLARYLLIKIWLPGNGLQRVM